MRKIYLSCVNLDVEQQLMKNETLKEKQSEDYFNKLKEFDKRFKILVDKGGLNRQTYENHRHFYCLGYYS